MSRLLIIASITIGLFALPAWAQNSGSNNDNLTVGAVHGGTPGSWVRAAIARHNELIDLRVNAARAGEEAGVRPTATGQTSGTSGTSSSLGDLSSLLSLASQYGDLGSLGSLIGSLTGSTTGSTTDSGSGTGNYTLADLIALGQAYGNQKTRNTQQTAASTSQGSSSSGTTQSSNQRVFGGAIARLPKPEERFQQATTQPSGSELGFGTRWANAMLQTLFTSLTLGFQSDAFIEALKDALRPLVLPSSNQGSGTGNGSGNGSSGNGGNGIEDLTPADGGNGGSSTL
jgi:hypothetical protein